MTASKNKYYEGSQHVCCWSMLSIEIKKSDKPWVIFTSKRRFTDTGGYGLLNHTNNISSDILTYQDIMQKYPGNMKRIGRNEYVALAKDGHPQIYNALLSSVKSSIEQHRLAEEHKEAYDETSFDIVFYTPVVVVDGILFEAYLNEDDDVEVKPSSHIVFNLNYASPSYKRKSYLVDIVTLNGLEDYLVSQEKWIEKMRDSIIMKVNQED